SSSVCLETLRNARKTNKSALCEAGHIRLCHQSQRVGWAGRTLVTVTLVTTVWSAQTLVAQGHLRGESGLTGPEGFAGGGLVLSPYGLDISESCLTCKMRADRIFCDLP